MSSPLSFLLRKQIVIPFKSFVIVAKGVSPLNTVKQYLKCSEVSKAYLAQSLGFFNLSFCSFEGVLSKYESKIDIFNVSSSDKRYLPTLV